MKYGVGPKKLLETNLICVVRDPRIYENSTFPAYASEKNKKITPCFCCHFLNLMPQNISRISTQITHQIFSDEILAHVFEHIPPIGLLSLNPKAKQIELQRLSDHLNRPASHTSEQEQLRSEQLRQSERSQLVTHVQRWVIW